MPNTLVVDRLGAILKVLKAIADGGGPMSSASKGTERELFISMVLENVIAPPFRIGTGDVTDLEGRSSGQVDVVIEYGSSISFPLIIGTSARLYLAPGICAVVEVKSNLTNQWDQVLDKAKKVSALVRDSGSIAYSGARVPDEVPFFAVGYRGWSTMEKTKEMLAAAISEGARVDGILSIDKPIYCGRAPDYSAHSASGPAALFGFLLSIEQLTSSMIHAKPGYLGFGL